MHAVIKTGGKQYRVAEGDVIKVEKLVAEAGSEVKFDQVLMVSDGESITLGKPMIDGGTVTAKVEEQARAKKIDIIKFRRRKHYRRQAGHRQYYTAVRITGINAG